MNRHPAPPSSRILARTALFAALIAGTTDILAAFVLNLSIGPVRVLQAVAGGLLGADAFAGGLGAAVLGLTLHYLLMGLISAGFVALSVVRPALLKAPVRSGLAYGLMVWAVMSFVVVPLSAAPLPAPVLNVSILTPILVHMLLVGLPIALVTRRMIGPTAVT